MTVIVVSFLAVLLVITAIGAASVFRARGTPEDYLVASRSVHPALTALSSVATNNSGYMFVGLVGFAYAAGLQAMWLQIGWILGDMVAWAWLHRRVRQESEKHDVKSLPTLLGKAHGHGGSHRRVVVASALLTLFLLSAYAAAQLNAGSKALHVLFGWDEAVGAVIGAVIVVIYCFAGGIRASIWTDVAQSFIMIISLSLLAGMAVSEIGGFAALFSTLREIDPALVQIIPGGLALGFAPWFVGFVFGGFGVIGQPHILVRTMAMRSASEIPRARRVYFAWFIPFSIASVLVGLTARVLLPDLNDVELALPQLGLDLLPGVLVGFLLAGLFSATMSTADSQILASSAAITHDLAPRIGRSYLATKLGTLVIAAMALAIALTGPRSVFALVLMAWSALATTLGPVLLLRMLRWPMSDNLALAVMGSGLGGMALWRYLLHLDGAIYEIFPGLVAAFGVYGIARLLGIGIPPTATEAVTSPLEGSEALSATQVTE